MSYRDWRNFDPDWKTPAKCNHQWSAPYLLPSGRTTHVTQRCILPKGHDTEHRSSTKVTKSL